MHPSAKKANFDHLQQHEQVRYAELLRQLYRLRLSCRCELVGGKDFTIIVAHGLATPQFWLDVFDLPLDETV